MERRGVHDAHGLEKVQRSQKKGSLKEGHELYHRRTRSEACECLAEIVSLPRGTEEQHEVVLPIKIPEVMGLHGRLVRDPRVKTGSNAEFIGRYNLAIEEDRRRGKERAKSVIESLERIRGRGSVMRVVSRAPPMEMEESETAASDGAEVTEEEKWQERLRRELKGIFRNPA